MNNTGRKVIKALEKGNGILRLKPAWVARKHIPSGKRFNPGPQNCDPLERDYINERWLASTTKADDPEGPEDGGLSYINMGFCKDLTLAEAVNSVPEHIMGRKYSKKYTGLGRLAKILDYGCRIPFHLHQMEKDANMVGEKSKDEAYYFPEGFDMGKNPETFFGVHPYINELKKYDILLPYLEQWDSDLILKHSRAYLNTADDGFLLQSGILHAPGSALTIELQEDSDVGAILQAKVEGEIISKELLYKDISREWKRKYRERAVIKQVNWKDSGDPYFYENHHLRPVPVDYSRQDGGTEFWIFYSTRKFSGKKLIIKPGHNYISRDNGVYNILVLKGEGIFDSTRINAKNEYEDELLVSHEKAVKEINIKNTGRGELIIIKFFGPGINNNYPEIEPYGQ